MAAQQVRRDESAETTCGVAVSDVGCMDCLAEEKKQSSLKLKFSARRVQCHCSARQSPSVGRTRFSNSQPRASLYLHQPMHISVHQPHFMDDSPP